MGQALLFADLDLAFYGLIIWLIMATFVRWYEEPTLQRTFGDEYDRYRRAVARLAPATASAERSLTRATGGVVRCPGR